MDEEVVKALRTDRIIDITTVGRKTGQPRRIEIGLVALKDSFFLSGRPGRPRSWYANLRAHPDFTVHLKRSLQRDLPTRATPITDPAERRAIFTAMVQEAQREDVNIEERLAGSPLVRLEFL